VRQKKAGSRSAGKEVWSLRRTGIGRSISSSLHRLFSLALMPSAVHLSCESLTKPADKEEIVLYRVLNPVLKA